MSEQDSFLLFHSAASEYFHWFKTLGVDANMQDEIITPKLIIDKLNKYGKEVCEKLIGDVSNKHDEFTMSFFRPYPGSFGGEFEIRGEQTKTRINLCFSYDGYELKLDPIFWEEIRRVDIKFFHFLSEASEGSKFLYEPNQGNENEVEKEYELSFKKVSNPIYELIRDIVLMNDEHMEGFNLVVRFDSFDHMSKNATNAFKNLYAANYLLYRKAYLRQHPKNKRNGNSKSKV